jgi:hypothetical protein
MEPGTVRSVTITSIPASWGDLTVTQCRIDASNGFKVVNTSMLDAAARASGSLTVSGKWARAAPSNDDPKGAAQGADLIVVSSNATSS